MRKIARWTSLIVCTIGLASGFAISPSEACIIDGIPSISANGHLATDNHANPAANTTQLWAPFLFSQKFRKGQSIRFAEDSAKLKKVLAPTALQHPWRWTFDDGVTQVASVVHHSFARPGRYRIVVAAYYSQYHAWMTFDDAIVVVGP